MFMRCDNDAAKMHRFFVSAPVLTKPEQYIIRANHAVAANSSYPQQFRQFFSHKRKAKLRACPARTSGSVRNPSHEVRVIRGNGCAKYVSHKMYVRKIKPEAMSFACHQASACGSEKCFARPPGAY